MYFANASDAREWAKDCAGAADRLNAGVAKFNEVPLGVLVNGAEFYTSRLDLVNAFTEQDSESADSFEASVARQKVVEEFGLISIYDATGGCVEWLAV